MTIEIILWATLAIAVLAGILMPPAWLAEANESSEANESAGGPHPPPGQAVERSASQGSSSLAADPPAVIIPADDLADVTWDEFFAAIAQVESGGDDNAIGDDGWSRGRYQIREAYWLDSGTRWEYPIDAKSPTICRDVMYRYWCRYCPVAVFSTPPDWETMARVHNGGPRGAEKTATIEYWRKVEAVLNSKEPTR